MPPMLACGTNTPSAKQAFSSTATAMATARASSSSLRYRLDVSKCPFSRHTPLTRTPSPMDPPVTKSIHVAPTCPSRTAAAVRPAMYTRRTPLPMSELSVAHRHRSPPLIQTGDPGGPRFTIQLSAACQIFGGGAESGRAPALCAVVSASSTSNSGSSVSSNRCSRRAVTTVSRCWHTYTDRSSSLGPARMWYGAAWMLPDTEASLVVDPDHST